MSVATVQDLRPIIGIARNQGSRPTCCAFACSDLHAMSRPPWKELSCEYVFWKGVRRQGTPPSGGVSLHHTLEVLKDDGQPAEKAWPYLMALPTDLTIWVPPTDVGELFRAQCGRIVVDLAMVRSMLNKRQPVLLVASISDAFYFGPDSDGVIDSPEPIDQSRVHAVIAVGHGTRGSDPLTLVRNSWGQTWGILGHAWITDRYLGPRLIDVATVTKVI
jgi:hypothetical protein